MTNISSFLFLPGCCTLCRRESARERDLCGDCEMDLPVLGAACTSCAMPLPLPANAATRCGACLRQPPPQDMTRALFRYAFPLDALIQRFKFQRDHAAGRVLGNLFAHGLHSTRDPAPVLVPVPLHERRLRERGYNQAELLARDLAVKGRYALRTDIVRRARETAVQSGMNARARRRNVRNAFALTSRDIPAHVAIIDDVITTGSTTQELARLFRRAGAERVDVWTLARTE